MGPRLGRTSPALRTVWGWVAGDARDPNETAWVVRARDGDIHTFEILVRRSQGPMQCSPAVATPRTWCRRFPEGLAAATSVARAAARSVPGGHEQAAEMMGHDVRQSQVV